MTECPFALGEIVLFTSYFRFETYVAQVQQIHLDHYGHGVMPTMDKATDDQKRLWYENDSLDLVIEEIRV